MFLEAQGEQGGFFDGVVFLFDKSGGPQGLFLEAQGE